MGQLLPIHKPNPLAADDVDERVSHGAKATTQIVRELLGGERGDRLQNPVVRPAVVFVEQLNVIFSHSDGGSPTLSSGNHTLPEYSAKTVGNPEMIPR
jgi:hypothetical protein